MTRFACEFPSPGTAPLAAAALQARVPALATDRLVLRAPKVEDFETYADILCSERGRYLGGPMRREDAWVDYCMVVAGWLLHGHGGWTIGHDGAVAGFVLLGFEPGDEEPELGFLLAGWAEGRGIAFEAARAARAHAFERLGWRTLVSYIDPANRRSIALAERLGARLDGRIDAAGEDAPTLIYRHDRSDA